MSNQQGLSISDIGPVSKDVPIGDGRCVRVLPISATDVFQLLGRFPLLQTFMTGQGVKSATLFDAVPEAIGAIIARATTKDKLDLDQLDKDEETAKLWPVQLQMDVIQAVAEISFTRGFGPFVEQVAEMFNAVASESVGKVQDLNSQPQSSASPPPGSTTPSPGV